MHTLWLTTGGLPSHAPPFWFSVQVKAVLGRLSPVYNPISRTMTPWIDVAALQKHFRKQGLRGGQSGGCAVS